MDAAQSKTRRVLVALLLVVISLGVLVATTFAVGYGDVVLTAVNDVVRFAQGLIPEEESGPSASREPTGTAEPTSTVPGGASNAGDGDAMSRETKLFQEWMYWEQVDSQESIAELIKGEWAHFTLGEVRADAKTAEIALTGKYKTGADISGTLMLRELQGNWYVTGVTARGHVSPGPGGRTGADSGVMKTLFEEQSESGNQSLLAGLRDGSYRKVAIDGIRRGSRTATIDVTFSDGSAGVAAGRIVCVSAGAQGQESWFVARCERR